MRHAIAAAGLVLLAGCTPPAGGGNGTDPAAGGSAAGPDASASSDERWNAEDACSLLDKRTVGAALGTEIVATELSPVTERTDDRAGFSTCFYKLADGQQLAFLARQSPAPDNTAEAIQKTREETVAMIGEVEDVTGVGKSAFWSPKLRQLVVFLGEDRYFNLTMPANLGAKDPKTIALGLATRIE